MRVEQLTMAAGEERGVARWFLDRAVYELDRIWAYWWWMLRVHVAARNGIPRDCLEDPPAAWMTVMQRRGDQERQDRWRRARRGV